ncbi:hypothetical protein DN402_19285 [Streptomyces sp. SW4]|nr:hypothetical protein DN402_19285 [Streptomyces sp. SW4]
MRARRDRVLRVFFMLVCSLESAGRPLRSGPSALQPHPADPAGRSAFRLLTGGGTVDTGVIRSADPRRAARR